MKTWNLSDTQSHLAELVESSSTEPQIIAHDGEPVAALIDIRLLNEWLAFRQRPTIADLLAELAIIQSESPLDFEDPTRIDRPNPLIEAWE